MLKLSVNTKNGLSPESLLP